MPLLATFSSHTGSRLELYRITYSAEERIATIVLNCPEKNNSLDNHVVAELNHAFLQAQRDSSVKLILLRAEGDDFCTGTDPDHLERTSKFDFNQNLQDSADMMKLFMQIYTLRKPVIALVQGRALAAGCGLAAVCDFIVAAHETARFGFTESKEGSIPALALIFLVRRIGEARARELAIRGRIIDADEAQRIGLINQVAPAIELEVAGKKLAAELIAENSSASMRLIKELLSRMHGMSLDDTIDYASNLQALTRMTDECKKGIEALRNNKVPRW